MIKKLAVLGSTGSIGRDTLEVARGDGHRVVAISFNTNYKLGLEQYYEFRPELIAVEDEAAYHIVKEQLKEEEVEVLHKGGAAYIAEHSDYDVILIAIVGIAGLEPAYKAAQSSKRIAIANKEALVAFGESLLERCKEHGTELIPVDSEHSAIFQCLQGSSQKEIDKILLTCSGGPFRRLSREEIAPMKAEQAIKHPKWSMGKKISIDSATLMNKGLELIEAMRLFQVRADEIEIIVHPESIVHSAVLFKDGSTIAQLSEPDMKIAIRYAINYPHRWEVKRENQESRISFLFDQDLHFEKPDFERFPCLKLAIEAANKGGIYPAVLNSANEACCRLYLEGKIGFYDISTIISAAINRVYDADTTSLAEVYFCHREVYNSIIEKYSDTVKA